MLIKVICFDDCSGFLRYIHRNFLKCILCTFLQVQVIINTSSYCIRWKIFVLIPEDEYTYFTVVTRSIDVCSTDQTFCNIQPPIIVCGTFLMLSKGYKFSNKWRPRFIQWALHSLHLHTNDIMFVPQRHLKWGALSLKSSVLKKTHIFTPFNVKIASNYAFLFLN